MFDLSRTMFAAALLILAGVQTCFSSPPLYSCATIPYSGCSFGNPSVKCPSVCSYFFDAVETALVSDSSALYTLQRAFFPDGEQKPNVVDIYVSLVLEQAVNLSCDSELNIFRNERIASLSGQNASSLCSNDSGLSCIRKEYRWHHVWTSAVLTNVIERESLGLISSINSLAYITRLYSEAQFNVIVTTQNKDFQPREVTFLELIVPSLLCLPSNNTEATFRGAWEEIIPWVNTKYYIES